MPIFIRFLYNLNRLALLLLTAAFLSFYLVTLEDWRQRVEPLVEGATRYLPVLLVPCVIVMLGLLILRYLMKKENEKITFGDVLAGLLSVVGQIAVIALYRAQGNEVLNASLISNIPNVDLLSEKAAPASILGVAALQFVTSLLYWVSDPDKRARIEKKQKKAPNK